MSICHRYERGDDLLLTCHKYDSSRGTTFHIFQIMIDQQSNQVIILESIEDYKKTCPGQYLNWFSHLDRLLITDSIHTYLEAVLEESVERGAELVQEDAAHRGLAGVGGVLVDQQPLHRRVEMDEQPWQHRGFNMCQQREPLIRVWLREDLYKNFLPGKLLNIGSRTSVSRA